MVKTIDMQHMRYINLFNKITRVQTSYCSEYNNALVFSVPKVFLSKALGENARNLRKLNGILGKKIKIVPIPRNEKDAEVFIRKVIAPTEFNEIEIGEEIKITAGRSNKAALLGRGKKRLEELQKISSDFFDKDLKIV